MSNVFANGLEISGKAVGAKTVAAFPDVCFTPPENPATPPGVPVPYPSFGMADDTEKGTGTVFIGGKTVNIKNKSDLSKTTGTEAGAAAKKGVITSKNTGKAYFHSWSPNVKFDSEPVIRNTDMTTDNHASPQGNTPPWVHIASMAVAGGKCEKVYSDLDGHPHGKSPCNTATTGDESEHTNRASAFLHTRQSETRSERKCTKQWPNYDEDAAPCICMHGKRINKKADERRKKGTAHSNKTEKENNFLNEHRGGCMIEVGPQKIKQVTCQGKCTVPTVDALTKASVKASVEEHPKTKDEPNEDKKKEISECLELIQLTFLAGVDENDTEEEAKKKTEDVKKKKICGKGVCKKKDAKCVSCGVT